MKQFESLYPNDSYFKEIEKIIQFLKEGNSCQIIGLPGVGKSNLLRLLAYNHELREKHFGKDQEYVHFVYMNFFEIKTNSLFEVNKFIFLSLADSLRDRGMEIEHKKVHSIFKEHFLLNDELVLFQGLKEAINYLALEKKLSVILLFDRFQEHFSFLTSEFFANLRILRNVAKYRFAAVFALNRPLEEALSPEIITHFHEFLAEKIVFLPITDSVSLSFRISYLEKLARKKLGDALIKKIVEITGGHNKLTMFAVESCIGNEKEIKDINIFLMEKSSVQFVLLEVWNFLTEQEKEQVKNSNTLGKLSFLNKVGLMKDGAITIPLFEQFIQQELYKKAVVGKISFDKNENKIKIGEKVISDTLTSLEFNLLRFLIENENKILEREEIINAVWKETATVAGVTDEALDQLIFRLRKKIESNLDESVHLLSIKGRGLLFRA